MFAKFGKRWQKNRSTLFLTNCPFWPAKEVHETHLLVLVPETVRGQPLTIKGLGELIENPLQGYVSHYIWFDLGKYTDPPAASLHWVLMTRDVIEFSRNKSYQDQQTILTQKSHGVYEVPNLLDANVSIFIKYVRSGTRLYNVRPCTWTRCQEKFNADWQLVVESFGAGGLYVFLNGYDSVNLGVGGCRKL